MDSIIIFLLLNINIRVVGSSNRAWPILALLQESLAEVIEHNVSDLELA